MSSPRRSAETDPNIMEGPRKCHPPAHFAEDEGPVVSRKKPKPVMVNRTGKSKTKANTGQQVSVGQASDSPQPCTHAHPPNRNLEDMDESSDEERRRSVTYECLDAETVHGGGESESDDEPQEEDDITELSCISKKWDAPVYIFFKASPTIEYFDGRKAHVFECGAMCCCCKSKFIQQYLYTVVGAADTMGNLKVAREALLKKEGLNGSITAAFEWVGKSKVTYSHRVHTRLEAQSVKLLHHG
ncbi:hypothetical protein EI94DRAFT_1709447 [Lactarius quietus]|nr:hypothetical protein EI94DRAFT_1709447 [Lactarius quietus]